MEVPQTRYARTGDLQIAYQVVGGGPLDVGVRPVILPNVELFWELPSYARFFERLSSFSRLIQFDRRGSGMSDGTRRDRRRSRSRSMTSRNSNPRGRL